MKDRLSQALLWKWMAGVVCREVAWMDLSASESYLDASTQNVRSSQLEHLARSREQRSELPPSNTDMNCRDGMLPKRETPGVTWPC